MDPVKIPFLKECLDKGLRLYAVPYAIAEIDQDAASSWFTGYTEKYFYDKGALYASLYPRIWRMIAVRFLLRTATPIRVTCLFGQP